MSVPLLFFWIKRGRGVFGEGLEFRVGKRALAPGEPELHQREPFLDLYRKRPGHYLKEELARVAAGDVLEPRAPVREDPGEHIEPACRRLGVGPAPYVLGELQCFHEGDKVDMAPL